MYNTSFIHLSMSDKEDLLMIRVERFLVLMATLDIFADLAWLPILVGDDSFNQLIGVIRPWIRVWKPKNPFPLTWVCIGAQNHMSGARCVVKTTSLSNVSIHTCQLDD